MRNLRLGANFTIFILFFGLALLDALGAQNWPRIAVFVALAALCLWADAKRE